MADEHKNQAKLHNYDQSDQPSFASLLLLVFSLFMETHPNRVLIQRFFTAYAANDQPAISQLLSPSIRWHIPGNHPLSGTKVGVSAVLDYFAQLGRLAFQASPIVMGVNDQYVIDCHLNWNSSTETDRFEAMSCLLWHIEAGVIVEVHNFPQDQHQTDAFFQTVYG